MRSIRIIGPGIALALSLPIGAPLMAQMHHVDKPERVTRAVGVYEWTGDMTKPDASRLIPVSIFINNHFEDAGVYLAHPIPLALETGNIYDVQRSGSVVGNLNLDFARDIVDKRSSGDDNPLGAWYGYGRFIPPSAAPPAHKLTQHAAAPTSIVGSDDDSRPHFVPSRHPSDSSSTSNSSSTPTAKNDSSSNPAPSDDPDRPRMARRDSDPSSSSSPSSSDNAPISTGTNAQGTGDVPADDPDRPTLGHRDDTDQKKQKKQKESGSGVEAMPTSLNEDPDRPSLHRGKIESAAAPPQLSGVPPNLHQAVAVSDAASTPGHVFARDWESLNEKTQTLAAMQKLADPIARQYLATNHLQPTAGAGSGPKLATKPATTSAKSTTAHTATHSTAAHHTTSAAALPPLSFSDAQIAGYSLSYGGLPTFIYTASLPTTSGPADGPVVHVTIVAQRLPSGELQTSLSSVTDEQHLDRTPWMRLVDAVDPDDSHRASLLFELRAQNTRQFALYSLATADAQQTFVTGVIE
jgi:hypothetical protein